MPPAIADEAVKAHKVSTQRVNPVLNPNPYPEHGIPNVSAAIATPQQATEPPLQSSMPAVATSAQVNDDDISELRLKDVVNAPADGDSRCAGNHTQV